MSSPTGTDLRAGRQEWTGLAVLALATLLLSLDLSVLYLALPHLAADLGASGVQQLWILDIYGFLIAGFLVTMGNLGDRIGRRRILMFGAVGFAAASVLAAFSTSPEMLIAARALMGVAGATVMPSCLALITAMFRHPGQRNAAVAGWMSCFMVGILIGPLIGGVMLELFWWGSVFLLGVPVMLVLVLAAPRVLPESRDPDPGRLDLFSVGLSLLAILPFIYGIKELAKDGWQPLPLLVLGFGLLAGLVFGLRQARLANPLLDLRLCLRVVFAAALVLGVLGGAIQGGSSLLVIMYLQMVEGLSPLRAGLWLMPATILMIIGLMLGPGLAQRFRPGYVIIAGPPIALAGYLVLTQVQSTGGLAMLVVGWSIVLFGVGIPMGLGTSLGLSAVPQARVGSASSLLQTGNELGVALGIAVLGSIGTAVYRSQLTVPESVPAEAAEVAREGIPGATAVAGQVQAGAELLVSAREAFTSGLTTVAVICAVVMLGLAVFAAIVLRNLQPIPVAEPAADGQGPESATADTPAAPAAPGANP
jgi:DHA2 family multidrug resistance protein-like MFS transporter